MLRPRRALAVAIAALLLSLSLSPPAAAQGRQPAARPGLTAAVLEGAGSALHRLWDKLRRLYDDIHGTLDPNGGG